MKYFSITTPLVSSQQAYNSWDSVDADAHAAAAHAAGRTFLAAVVGPTSPLSLRRALQQIAHYFKRELQYDFLQYEIAWEGPFTAFLWGEPDYLDGSDRIPIIGACLFQPITFKDIGPMPVLSWIWIHPYRRRSGLLTAAWPYFEARFKRFVVDQPRPAMRAFLKNRTVYDSWMEEWIKEQVV